MRALCAQARLENCNGTCNSTCYGRGCSTTDATKVIELGERFGMPGHVVNAHADNDGRSTRKLVVVESVSSLASPHCFIVWVVWSAQQRVSFVTGYVLAISVLIHYVSKETPW